MEPLSLPLAAGTLCAVPRMKPNVTRSFLAGAGPTRSQQPTDVHTLIS